GPFGAEIKAHLTWFPRGDRVDLAWEVLLTMPDYAGQYVTLVDASSGDILYCHQLVQTVAAVGNVYRVDGGSPRQTTKFPRAVGDYGLPFPAGGAHDKTGSGNYTLINQTPLAFGQHGWRWCHKCQGLYFAGNPGSKCP